MRKSIAKPRKLNFHEVFRTADGRWRAADRGARYSIPTGDLVFDAALAIYEGDALVRAELEARILSEQTGPEIAAKMGIREEVIACYEEWFFDLRDLFGFPCFVIREAIGRHPSGILETHDVGPFWRWVGFCLGQELLEPLFSAVDRKTLREKGIDAYLAADVRLCPLFKLVILIERMPPPRTVSEWIQLFRYWLVLSDSQVQPVEELMGPFSLEFADTDDIHLPDFAKTLESLLSVPAELHSGPEIGLQVVAQCHAV